MADDPRYDAATAVTGAALLGGGGTLRHHAIRRAYPKGKQPKIHALAMMRKAPKGKKQFWAGSAIGALGLPPLALGTTRLARGDVDKAAKPRTPQERADRLDRAARRAHLYSIEQARAGNLPGVRRATRVRNARAGRAAMLWTGLAKADNPHKPGFWREGLRGTKEALGQRADSYRQPVPTKLRAAQLGVGAATGAVGSVVARAALGRRGDALKPFVTPIAGGLAATGSVPLTNRAIHSRYPDYEVTPSGVRRKKKPIVMPSKMSSQHRGTPRSLRRDVNKAQAQVIVAKGMISPIATRDAGDVLSPLWPRKRQKKQPTQPVLKADDKRYLGARTPYATQRAVTTASTHTPVIGPFVSAGTAARYAPPGQGRKAAARQWTMSSGVGIPAGVAGAYGGAHLANRSDKAHHAAQTLVHTKDKVEGKARSMVGLKEKGGKGPVGRGVERFVRTKAGKPFRTPRGAIGGAAGMVVARGIAGGVGDQAAITMNQNAQRRYNKVHHIEKAAGPGQTKREKHDLANQKRRTAALSTASGLLGLGSLGLIATGRRNAAVTTGILGSGIGGTNSLLGARVQRKEAQNVDPVKKALGDPAAVLAHHAGNAYRDARMNREGFLAMRQMQKEFPQFKEADEGRAQVHRGVARQQKLAGQALTRSRRRLIGKAFIPGTDHWDIPKNGLVQMVGSGGKWASAFKDRTNPLLGVRYVDPEDVHEQEWTRARLKAHTPFKPHRQKVRARTTDPKLVYRVRKAAPLEIKGSDRDHHDMIRRYGDRGPLPKGLSREDRMKAYEARYVHHGGDKANAWSRRAATGNTLKNAGVGVGTAGGAAWLATRGKSGIKRLAKHPNLARHAETTAVAGATIGGAGEMLAGYAHRRQASYANSPGGVAASALRRMRAYTPETT